MYKGQKVKLEDIIRFGGEGYVKQITLNENNDGSCYDYRIDAVGAGPSSGYGHLYFTDYEPDIYSLKFYKHEEHSDYVRFNSKKPIIQKIEWNPADKIKPLSDEAVFIYNDSMPGCITSEDGLHVGQHVVVEHNGQRVSLQDIIKFGYDGYIKEIDMKLSTDFYNYKIDTIGAGPSSGYGYLYFRDGEPDTYTLKFYNHTEHSDYVRFNSKVPVIHYITWEPAEKKNAKWMKFINDNIPINKLSIPGTHDSLTWNITNLLYDIKYFPSIPFILLQERIRKFCQTQNETLKDQLDFGCRFFDIRLDENLHGCHGNKILGADCKYDLYDVLNEAKSFLEMNPEETIIMRIKNEDGRGSIGEDKINDVVNKYADLFWYRKNKSNNKWPIMADVRGKVVVLDSLDNNFFVNHDIGFIYGNIDSFVEPQDDYENPDKEKKLLEIIKNIELTEPEKMKVNFVSATGETKEDPVGGLFRSTPGEYADVLNPQVLSYLDSHHCSTGLLIFDYVTQDIVQAVIAKNQTL